MTTGVDSAGAEMPEVQVSFPYRSLVFQREQEAFVSEVLVLVVATRDGDRVGGGIAQCAARVTDYEDTRSSQHLVCRVPVRLRGDGPVQLQLEAGIAETSRRWKRSLSYRPQAAKMIPLIFAGFSWNMDGVAAGGSHLGIHTDSLRVVISLAPRPGDPQWPEGGLILSGRVQSPDGQPDLVQRLRIAPSQLGGKILDQELLWQASELPFGQLALLVQLEGEFSAGTERLSFDPARPFVNLQVPWRDEREWRRHIGWLDGIIAAEQRAALAGLPTREREEAWRAVWQSVAAKSGAAPEQVESEHLLRIVEADRQFGVFGRGALTDRGRVFIRYGRPDRIENRGDEMSQSSQWEIWYYFDARLRFTFYDPHGMRDYQLYESTPY